MTCREKLKIEHHDCVNSEYLGGCIGCPSDYGYLRKQEEYCRNNLCNECWDREIQEQDLSKVTFPTKEEHISECHPIINDSVSHPSHYTYGKIECIDFIFDKDLNFALGNAIKYIVRAGHKSSKGMSDEDKAIQDLEKAKQYIDFQIAHIKGEK